MLSSSCAFLSLSISLTHTLTHTLLLLHINHFFSLSYTPPLCSPSLPPTYHLLSPSRSGQKAEQVSGGIVVLHHKDLSMALKALKELEYTAQNNFLKMQSQFKVSS